MASILRFQIVVDDTVSRQKGVARPRIKNDSRLSRDWRRFEVALDVAKRMRFAPDRLVDILRCSF